MKILVQQIDHFQGELIAGVFYKGVKGDKVTVEDFVVEQVMHDFPGWFTVFEKIEPPVMKPVVVEEKMTEGSPENKMMKSGRRAIK